MAPEFTVHIVEKRLHKAHWPGLGGAVGDDAYHLHAFIAPIRHAWRRRVRNPIWNVKRISTPLLKNKLVIGLIPGDPELYFLVQRDRPQVHNAQQSCIGT